MLPVTLPVDFKRGGVARPWQGRVPLTDHDVLMGEPLVWMDGHKSTKEIKDIILVLLESGYSLPQICDSIGQGRPARYFPKLPQVMRWREKDPDFGEQVKFYNQARAAEMAEQVLWEVQEAAGAESDLQQMPFLEKKWKAMQWLIERMDSDNWTPKQRIETSMNPLERAGIEELRRRLQMAMENPVVREMVEDRLKILADKRTIPNTIQMDSNDIQTIEPLEDS